MTISSFLDLFKELCLSLFNFLKLIINQNIVQTIIAVFIGGYLSSKISNKQVKDSNNFIILNQSKNEIMENVNSAHVNVNEYIVLLGKICDVILKSNEQVINDETRFKLFNYTNDVTNVINSNRISGNTINANIRLLNSIYENENAVFDEFRKHFLKNLTECTLFMDLKLNKMLELMDKNQKKEIELEEVKKLANSLMFNIFNDIEIKEFINSDAFELYNFINSKISLLIKTDRVKRKRKTEH